MLHKNWVHTLLIAMVCSLKNKHSKNRFPQTGKYAEFFSMHGNGVGFEKKMKDLGKIMEFDLKWMTGCRYFKFFYSIAFKIYISL